MNSSRLLFLVSFILIVMLFSKKLVKGYSESEGNSIELKLKEFDDDSIKIWKRNRNLFGALDKNVKKMNKLSRFGDMFQYYKILNENRSKKQLPKF